MPSISPFVYLQACSVCRAEFVSETEWLKHLVQKDHQSLARNECLEKWDRKTRKSCIIIFTKVPITESNAGKCVSYFSNKINNGIIVSDFVWWEDRPHIGILQFESKQKAKEVLSLTSQHSKTLIIDETQRIQVKAGFELTSLEWFAMLPPTIHQVDLQIENSFNKERPKVYGNDNREEPQNQPTPAPADNIVINPISSTPNCQLINTASLLYSDRTPIRSTVTPASHPLQFQFYLIRKAMIIPDIQYEHVTTAVHSLKQILSKLDPNVEVTLFRNWFLKLQYPATNNNVFLYVHSNTKINQDSNILCKYVGNTEQRDFKVLKSSKEGQSDVLYIKHVASKTNILLMTSQTTTTLVEVQVCRLMEYMCQFDPRCYPLILLVCYWAKLNYISVSGSGHIESLPPHYTLQWLVLFFMYHQRYIPTPQQILKRYGGKNHTGTGGFHCDLDFGEEWKSKEAERLTAHQQLGNDVEESSEEFILSLLKLFSRFLSFCFSELGYRDKLILNLCNGIIIDKAILMYKPTTRYSHISNMTIEEIELFQKEIGNDKVNQQLEKCGLYMTHPMLLNHSMTISENIKSVLKLFDGCNEKLISFLFHVEKFGVESALKKGGNLKTVLTKDK